MSIKRSLFPFLLILRVYIAGLVVFTLFRLLLLVFNGFPEGGEEPLMWLVPMALWNGFRFDTVISGYLLAVPCVLIFSSWLSGRIPFLLMRFVRIYLSVVYILAFTLCAIDIPYFNHYFTRLDVAVLQWAGTPRLMAAMVFAEVLHWVFIGVLVAAGYLWIRLMSAIVPTGYPAESTRPTGRAMFLWQLLAVLMFFGLNFLAIRGRIEKKAPIKVGTAWFSSQPFYNQLGLNPVFSFMQSVIDQNKLRGQAVFYMDNQLAINKVRNYMDIADTCYLSPLARKTDGSIPVAPPNVVLVIMESMSMAKTGIMEGGMRLTPNLDSLARISASFSRIYTSGIHTFNGLYSTLYGFPAIGRQHPLNETPLKSYTGLPVTLAGLGYQTVCFIPHDAQFDNMSGFFIHNGFRRIYSLPDYPEHWILSTLGIPDHLLFDFTIETLDKLSIGNRPFFATILTGSDHPPFIIPGDISFKPRSAVLSRQIAEYADWSIGRFMQAAASRNWFEHTLFVFIADHGTSVFKSYEMPLSFHHTPLLFHMPYSRLPGGDYPQLGMQIDVFPTVMGVLGLPYVNNTPGVDLLNFSRPFVFFSADDRRGCLSDSLFLIIRDNGVRALYHYRRAETANILSAYPGEAAEMENYINAFFQASHSVIQSGLSGKPEEKRNFDVKPQ